MLATKILTRDEIAAVVADLKRRRSMNAFQNLVVFRLSCCCGLRRKEISGLQMRDIRWGPKPYVEVRKDNTKGRNGKRRARRVPLYWDSGTRADLERWYEIRQRMTSDPLAPFVCKLRKGEQGGRLIEARVADRWNTAVRCLVRAEELSIHKGRHSFISHALAAGVPLPQVRDAAGHASIATTNVYVSALDDGMDREVFADLH